MEKLGAQIDPNEQSQRVTRTFEVAGLTQKVVTAGVKEKNEKLAEKLAQGMCVHVTENGVEVLETVPLPV